MGPRILIVNANWVGDVLFSTPAIRALRKHLPDAHLACLVPPRARGVLEHNPRLNEILEATDDTTAASIPAAVRLARALAAKRFDTALFFHHSRTKARVARWAGIRERIGFAESGRAHLLTKAVQSPAEGIHRIDRYLSLLKGIGISTDDRRPEYFPSAAAESEARKLLDLTGVASGEPYVVVHAGGNWDLKRWPAASFARWIRLFRASRPWRVLLCGTSSEIALADEIRKGFGENEVASLCGRTSFDGLAALLRGAKFLVSNDSGPIHLAASQSTPIVALFGPTSPAVTGPVSGARVEMLWKDVGCEVPCYFRSCESRVCMEWLSPEEVLQRSLLLCA